jgi:hypothetical protein
VRLEPPIVAILVASLARAAKPAPVTPFPPDWPHACPFKLSRELLLPETERIVIVVDVPRGFPPKEDALDSLASLAAKYGGREARWVRLGSSGAPSIVWTAPAAAKGTIEMRPRVQSDAAGDDVPIPRDQKDSIRLFREAPSCPNGALPASSSFVFVRYLGEWGRDYGAFATATSDASCGGRAFPVLYLAQGKIARDRVPGMSQVFLEQRALAHEYGHALGLGSNPAHGRFGHTLPYTGGAHCVNRECAVAVPTAAALLKGQMLDYCADCRRDIEQARSYWHSGVSCPEVRRLPQPDPDAAVARLKTYNFREGGDADRLLGFGKAVMPALIKRMAGMPAGDEMSPRGYAATLGLRIIAAEDRKRRDDDTDTAPIHPTRDVSRELLVWWSAEGPRFLAGDDWKLPAL